MDAGELTGLIRGEVAYSSRSLAEVKWLTEEYPYFQAAQLLYTLHLQVVEDSRFQAELRKAACASGDRRNLFYRVRNDAFPPEWPDKLDGREEKPAADLSFGAIDLFLSEHRRPAQTDSELPSISADYLSYESDLLGNAGADATPWQQGEIIDKFLSENAQSPSRISLEGDPGPVFADLDRVEENSFFSETLAKIYLKQRKYGKALEVIRKLYLLYPEKNLYFADQIRFLEKLVIHKIK
jgi:hypothetical protein